MTGTIPCESRAPQGDIPPEAPYGSLRISLQADTIGTFLNPAVFPEHVFTGTFAARDSLFEEGDPATFVSFQFEPGSSCQIAIIDTCFDDQGVVNPSVLMFLPAIVLNGPADTGCTRGTDIVLYVVDWQDYGSFDCIHAVGRGSIAIGD